MSHGRSYTTTAEDMRKLTGLSVCCIYILPQISDCKRKKGENKNMILILNSRLGLIANESRKALGELSGLVDQKVSCRRAGLFPDTICGVLILLSLLLLKFPFTSIYSFFFFFC